ncbi:hypothetical protein [Longimicrobium sp.]|uniref:hypothetical protein n=1 Tax=Longimicrobium sp. TaxID=2029185 RepID=UPI002CCBFBB1|nr:hypothetical protein [Longimicrobium sp.]HSU14497.1 hypothetical protein [Longimicrobium sp.]
MRKIRLDAGDLAVTSFHTLPAPGGVHSAGLFAIATDPRPVPDGEPTHSCDTVEYACLAMTKLAEDCFGPTAGCPLNTADECPYCDTDQCRTYEPPCV